MIAAPLWVIMDPKIDIDLSEHYQNSYQKDWIWDFWSKSIILISFYCRIPYYVDRLIINNTLPLYE
jgi:hypothetical protein